MVEDLIAIVRALFADSLFLGTFPARVALARSDGTVDVEIDDDRLRGRGMSELTVRTGVAGASSRVNPGTVCLIGFDGGNPAAPCVRGWEYAHNSAVVNLAGGETPVPVARHGDLTELGIDALTTQMLVVMPPSVATQALISQGVATLPPGTIIPVGPLAGLVFTPAQVTGRIVASQEAVTA